MGGSVASATSCRHITGLAMPRLLLAKQIHKSKKHRYLYLFTVTVVFKCVTKKHLDLHLISMRTLIYLFSLFRSSGMKFSRLAIGHKMVSHFYIWSIHDDRYTIMATVEDVNPRS